MYDIELAGMSPSFRGISRQVERSRVQIEASTRLAVDRANSRAAAHAAQVDALAAVTQRGLQGAAFLTQVEQQLAQAVPLAASRLEAIGQIGTLGLTQIVMDTANALRQG